VALFTVYVAATPRCAERKKNDDPIQIRWKKEFVLELHFKNEDAIDAKALGGW
jgi:hypothetical protein